jgi:hypothetical protein
MNAMNPNSPSRLSQMMQNISSNVQTLLTAVWLVSFSASLLIVNSYVGRIAANGKQMVPMDDRFDCLQPLLILYSAYLVGILAFWFVKPIRRPEHNSPVRAVIALFCTALFSLAILYCVSLNYLFPASSTNVIENVKLAAQIASALSFIVAPVNLYYFGMKMPGIQH